MTKQPGVGSAVYKVVEVIGTSTHSWEDAAKNAAHAAGSSRGEVVKTDICRRRQGAGVPHPRAAVLQI